MNTDTPDRPVGILERKSFPVELKATGAPGHFEGYASIWDNVDSYGDVMVKGAFTRSLSEWGMPMLSWEHEWALGPIGVLTEVREDGKGLFFAGDLFIDSDLPKRISQAIAASQVKKASFAFLTRNSEEGEVDGEKVRRVTDVDLPEVAIVVIGANDEAGVRAKSLMERAAVAAIEEVTEPVPEPEPEVKELRFESNGNHFSIDLSDGVQEAHDRLAGYGAKCGVVEPEPDATAFIAADNAAFLAKHA